MANATEERLWWWAKNFSNHFSADGYRELGEVKESLQNPSSPANRERALVFSMYQLLINGAIGEHNVQEYQSLLPDFVRAQLRDEWLEQAAVEAWRGSAFTPPRSNILGSIAFMVALLFFFESCCRMKLNDYDSRGRYAAPAARNRYGPRARAHAAWATIDPTRSGRLWSRQ